MNFIATKLLLGCGLILGISSRFIEPLIVSVGYLAFRLFARKEIRQLRINIATVLCLRSTTSFAKDFERQCIKHQIRASLHTLQDLFTKHPIQVENLAEYRQFLEKARTTSGSLIIVTAHIGCWELIAKYTALSCGTSLAVLAKPARFNFLSDFLEAVRSKAGVKVLWNDSRSLLRDMLGTLKGGNALGFVMDQKPKNRVGTTLSFLGIPAEFVSGPATVALKANTPVVAAYLLRTTGRTYRVCYKLIWDGHTEVTPEHLLSSMILSIEDIIRLYPEQWTWNYKRWKWPSK